MPIQNELPRRDGHTHTEFCLHGSRESAESMIGRAIELGFTSYSLTEHPPLPSGFEDPAPDKTCGISWNDLDCYLRMSQRLKQEFAGQIDLKAGLEVDFISGFEAETRKLLDYCGTRLEDSLLSVHFLPGKKGWRCVDHSLEDFEEGMLGFYGSIEAVHQAYWDALKQALLSDLGPYKPRRIGHLSLVHKFQLRHPLQNPQQFRPAIEAILDLIAAGGMEIDLDAAGLFKTDCREVYPAPWIIREALRRQIPMVYGSDAHSLAGVGQGFSEACKIVADASSSLQFNS
jgi:histidinol-phosphatase (PHP family)